MAQKNIKEAKELRLFLLFYKYNILHSFIL
jgi:hypothetical protein